MYTCIHVHVCAVCGLICMNIKSNSSDMGGGSDKERGGGNDKERGGG